MAYYYKRVSLLSLPFSSTNKVVCVWTPENITQLIILLIILEPI